MSADVEIVREAMVCEDHQGDSCPCLEWAPEAHAALTRLEARLAEMTGALERIEQASRHLKDPQARTDIGHAARKALKK